MSTVSAQPSVSAKNLFQVRKVALDKLPGLRSIFDAFAVGCTERLRRHCAVPISLSVESVTSASASEPSEAFKSAIIGRCQAVVWDAQIVIGIERRLSYAIVDLLFGGDGSEPLCLHDHPFGATELHALRRVMEDFKDCLAAALAPVEPTEVVLEEFAPLSDLVASTPGKEAVVIVRFEIGGAAGSDRLFVILPAKALLRMSTKMERLPPVERAVVEPAWTDRFLEEILQADVRLDAVISGPRLPLREIANFRLKQVLRLDAKLDTLLTLESLDKELFQCRLGQSDGQFTVSIE